MGNKRFFHGTGAQTKQVGDTFVPNFKIKEDLNSSIVFEKALQFSVMPMDKLLWIPGHKMEQVFLFSDEINGIVYELDPENDWYFVGVDGDHHYRTNKPAKITSKINFNLKDVAKIADVYKMKKFKFGTKKLAEYRVKKAADKYIGPLGVFSKEEDKVKFFKVLEKYAVKIEKD